MLHHALGYAVEQQFLDLNPVERVQWKAPEVAKTVDRRVVANPGQVRVLLDAVSEQGKTGDRLTAFFGCIYYAGARPSEALAITVDNLTLPEQGWGRLDLVNSEPWAGVDWTDDGKPRDRRGLKRRGQHETRPVPIPPELVALLRRHLDTYGTGEGGRLFRTLRGWSSAGQPLHGAVAAGAGSGAHPGAGGLSADTAAVRPAARGRVAVAERGRAGDGGCPSCRAQRRRPVAGVRELRGRPGPLRERSDHGRADRQQSAGETGETGRTGKAGKAGKTGESGGAGEPGKTGRTGEPERSGDVTDATGAGCDILEQHPAGTWRADSGEPDVA